MDLNITGNHIDVSRRLRESIRTKFSKLERHYDHITRAHVILTVNKIHHRAEATIHAGGREIFADATASDMLSAIDSLIDKLDRQVIKHKEKTARHRVSTH